MKYKIYKYLPVIFGCHCRDDRSFYYKGEKFPICARCTGELIGILLAFVTFFFFRLNIKLSLISILGLLCYLSSFLIYILILPKFNLSYIMPITSAISYIGIFILSALVLKETITSNGIIGAFIILVGIIIMNIHK